MIVLLDTTRIQDVTVVLTNMLVELLEEIQIVVALWQKNKKYYL